MADKLTKLSQAIRLGATFRPQCTGAYFLHQMEDPKDIRSCAVGAAFEAVTGRTDIKNTEEVNELYKRFGMACMPIHEQIVKANDYGVSRETIACWLESKGL